MASGRVPKMIKIFFLSIFYAMTAHVLSTPLPISFHLKPSAPSKSERTAGEVTDEHIIASVSVFQAFQLSWYLLSPEFTFQYLFRFYASFSVE